MPRLLDKYKKEGHHTKFKDLFAFFTNLELISEGLNFIIKGEISQAIAVFERSKDIPILASDKPVEGKFYKEFEKATRELKNLLLDVLVGSSKCMYIDAMIILHNSPDGQLQYDKSIQAEKNRNLLKQRQQ
jgi:hypothetical protein